MQKVVSYQKRGIKSCAELAASPGPGWLPLKGGVLVRKRGVKEVLILYNCLSVMFRKDKSILKKKQKKEGKMNHKVGHDRLWEQGLFI